MRFARLLLPADEGLALYAVQRRDREQAVAAMQELRALFDATHPARRRVARGPFGGAGC